MKNVFNRSKQKIDYDDFATVSDMMERIIEKNPNVKECRVNGILDGQRELMIANIEFDKSKQISELDTLLALKNRCNKVFSREVTQDMLFRIIREKIANHNSLDDLGQADSYKVLKNFIIYNTSDPKNDINDRPHIYIKK